MNAENEKDEKKKSRRELEIEVERVKGREIKASPGFKPGAQSAKSSKWLNTHPCLDVIGYYNGNARVVSTFFHLFTKVVWEMKRYVSSLLDFPTPCISNYLRRRLQNPFKSGYIILSEAKGEPLQRSWEYYRHDKSYRSRLFE